MRWFALFVVLLACSKPPSPPPPPPFVKIAQAGCRDMPLYYEYVGHVEANIQVNIKAQVAGMLVGQYFIEGQSVKMGDLLLKIDDLPFQAVLKKAEAELAQSIASLKQAQDTARRYSQLVQEQYISQLDYDQFITNVLTSEAAVKQAEADVMTAKINLDYCSLHAPVDGVTSQLQVTVGNYIPIGGDTPLMTVNQIEPIRVSIYVPEQDLPRIAMLQQKKPLTVLAYLQDFSPEEGLLEIIDNAVDENTGTILLQAFFPNSNKKLWPGEFVNARVILEIQKNAVVVPSPAVQIGQDGPYVYILNPDHTTKLCPVTLGQKEGDITIINQGLTGEETVIVEGQINLNPGVQVAIQQ
jgi:multidrug efflux system membrane fusion protein